MVDVVPRVPPHRLLRSVNTPNFPTADYIHNPDLSAVEGWNSRYWKVSGDSVLLMTQAERDAVDAALLLARKDSMAGEYDVAQPNPARAVLEIIIDEFNRQSVVTNAILDAINNANNLAALKDAVALITPRPTRTLADLRSAFRNQLDT